VRNPAAYLWAAPVSLLALPVVVVALATGAGVSWRDGVLEAGGGLPGRLLSRLVPGFPIGAITLGHVVLACDGRALARTRAHERAHVRQYERWGPLFPLAYLAASLAAAARGRSVYGGNAFERQACREAGEGVPA
jgi:hypothetical protein